jgi:PPK2 family polyphosphate:nucleotide phosphotransferase
MNFSKRYRVKPGEKVRLSDFPTDPKGHRGDEKVLAPKLEKCTDALRDLQYLLYAEGRRSLLICLQALDAAGKDGTITHVLSAMNSQGTHVHSFKEPSREELAHDFLWRVAQDTPRKGEVAIFNRSHYEDVLVVRVHKLVPKDVWSGRYDLINDFEKGLVANGTVIIKFFLHIDKDEQLRRFKSRIDDRTRHWKISESDYSERALWDDYTRAYEDVLSKTSTRDAPWYVIPANNKMYRNLAITRILVERLEALDMRFPAPTVSIKAVRRKFHAAVLDDRTHKRNRRVEA